MTARAGTSIEHVVIIATANGTNRPLLVLRCGRREAKSKTGWPDGRREFGSVSGAIKTVLAQGGTEMRMKDVHHEVERLLDGTVSFQSIADYLIKNSKGPKALFEKPKCGHYRLLRFEPG